MQPPRLPSHTVHTLADACLQQLGSIPQYNFVRKAASDFGWDWGPAFAPAGVRGSVQLRATSSAWVVGLTVRHELFDNSSASLTADALLLLPPAAEQPEEGMLTLALRDPDGRLQHQVAVSVLLSPRQAACVSQPATDQHAGEEEVAGRSQSLELPAPLRCRIVALVGPPVQLWWPHDLGPQALYTVNVTYQPMHSDAGSAASSATRRVGFRRVELVRQPLGTSAAAGAAVPQGETFFFRVNGLPLFARGWSSERGGCARALLRCPTLLHLVCAPAGANVVPAAVFESAVTPEFLRHLVEDARAVGMNMLRVWGGGRYQQGRSCVCRRHCWHRCCGGVTLPARFPLQMHFTMRATLLGCSCGSSSRSRAPCTRLTALGCKRWAHVPASCPSPPRVLGATTPWCAAQVEREVTHQASRLTGHPSIAVWGMTRVQLCSARAGRPSPLRPRPAQVATTRTKLRLHGFRDTGERLYAVDYDSLFVRVVRHSLLAVDPGAIYVDSSPSNGLLSEDPLAKRYLLTTAAG